MLGNLLPFPLALPASCECDGDTRGESRNYAASHQILLLPLPAILLLYIYRFWFNMAGTYSYILSELDRVTEGIEFSWERRVGVSFIRSEGEETSRHARRVRVLEEGVAAGTAAQLPRECCGEPGGGRWAGSSGGRGRRERRRREQLRRERGHDPSGAPVRAHLRAGAQLHRSVRAPVLDQDAVVVARRRAAAAAGRGGTGFAAGAVGRAAEGAARDADAGVLGGAASAAGGRRRSRVRHLPGRAGARGARAGAAQVQPRLPRPLRRPVAGGEVHVPDVPAVTVRRAAEGLWLRRHGRRRRRAAGEGVPRAAPAGKFRHSVRFLGYDSRVVVFWFVEDEVYASNTWILRSVHSTFVQSLIVHTTTQVAGFRPLIRLTDSSTLKTMQMGSKSNKNKPFYCKKNPYLILL